MILRCLGVTLFIIVSSGSVAASTAPKPSPPPRAETSRPCTVGNFKGVMLAGSSVCVRVSGFVRYEAATGRATPGARN